MTIIIYIFFAPLIISFCVPISLILCLINLLFAGPFVPVRERFTPIFKLFLFPAMCRKSDEYSIGQTLYNIVSFLGLFSYLLGSLYFFKIISIPSLPNYLATLPSTICGIVYFLSFISMSFAAFNFDFSKQKLFFVYQSKYEYRSSFEKYTNSAYGISVDWEWSSNFCTLTKRNRSYEVIVETNRSDDAVDVVAIVFTKPVTYTDIDDTATLLLRTYDNTATEKKIDKITSRLMSNIENGCLIRLLGYSIACGETKDGKYSVCVGLND